MLRHALVFAGVSLSMGAQSFFDPYVAPVGQWTSQGMLFAKQRSMIWLTRKGVRDVPQPKLGNTLPGFVKEAVPGLSASGFGGKAFYLDGRLWVNGWTGTDAVLFEQAGGVWKEAATVPSPDRRRRASLVPLRNGRFLVFCPHDSAAEPDKERLHFYGIYARDDKGVLQPRQLEGIEPKGWHSDPTVLSVVRFLRAAVLTDDHITLCCPEYGRFWVFSLEDGRLQREIDLYGGKAEKALKGLNVPRMVQQVQPMKDGRLLIAARDESILEKLPRLVRQADAANRAVLQPGLSPDQLPGAFAFHRKQMREVLLEIAHQRWFELDPSTGSLRRLNPSPVGAKDLLEPLDPETAAGTFWYVDAEGRVQYTASDFSAFQKEEAEASKKGKAPAR